MPILITDTMEDEQRIADLEAKVKEQEDSILELYKIVINQQQMINDRVVAGKEVQEQLNTLSEAILGLSRRMM